MRRTAGRRPLYPLLAVLLLAGALSTSSVVESPPAAAAVAGGGFTGVTPYRALDTREAGGGGCVTAGATRTLTVANVGGVPANAAAVVLNVTVAGPVSPGFLTVFPDGVARPLASNLNYVAGSVVPNRVTVKVGATGKVAFFASGGCPQVIVDITGYYAGGTAAAGGFTGITPARAVDTRDTGGALASGASRNVTIAGVGGVPANAAGAVLNVTVVAGGAAGFLTVYPCAAPRPTASNLNFTPGQVVPNAVTTRIGTGGCVTVYNGSGGPANVIVDIAGYYSTGSPAAGGFTGITPFRARDTRDVGGCLQPGESRAIPVVGLGGVPALGASVALNVTVVPSGPGFLTVFSDGVARPTASNLNFTPGQVVPNAVMAKVGAGGRVVVYNGSSGCNHVIVDVAAWYSTGLGATAAPQVALGGSHSCAIQTAATVKCWGSNTAGQLGNGAVIEGGLSFPVGGATVEPTPVSVLDLSDVTEIAAGAGHSCARTTGGTVKCWGSNYYGQLGFDPSGGAGALSFPSGTPQSTPVEVSGLSAVTQIAAGADHTCALLSDGTVRCWGSNSSGQLGNGTYNSSIAPVVVSGLSGVTRLTAGRQHTCAIVGGGSVRCWGANSQGQVGNGTNQGGFSFPQSGGVDTNVPTVTLDVSTATNISAGEYHTCVVVAGGAVQCWGGNWSGETGASPTAAVLRPTTVASLSGVTKVAAGGSSGGSFTCALVTGGSVRCWGGGYSGQLGNGSFDLSWTPTTVTGVSGAVDLAAGGGHACAVLPGGGNRCWGANESGQLGDGSINGLQRTPLSVAGQSGATSVAAGYGHSCAVVTGGTVRCWGANYSGQLGNADTTGTPFSPVGGPDQPSPQTVVGVSNATQVVAGGQHSCALSSAGTVRCWGANGSGQLGDGSFDDTSTSVAVAGLSGVTQLVAGGAHTCAIVAGGAVKCWGRNDSGQLGDGSVASGGAALSFPGAGGPPQASPVSVVALTGATRLSAGESHTCAVLSGGGVSCWGLNLGGQLGNGVSTNSSTPVTTDGVTGATEIGSGSSHTCAVVAGGAVRCWGADWSGQLGDGASGAASLVPVTVGSLSNAVRVAGGSDHTCAVLSSGGVRCWGSNATSQFGTGLGESSATPVVAATGVSTAVRLAAGYGHSCVTLSAGSVSCWGANEFGQVGGGDVGSGKALSVLVSGFPAV